MTDNNLSEDNLSSLQQNGSEESETDSAEWTDEEYSAGSPFANINHIFICSSGSVASGSLYHTFHKKYKTVEHVHQLKTIKEQVQRCSTHGDYTLFLMGVREPIARNISFFMQRCDHPETRVFYDEHDRNGYLGSKENIQSMDTEKIIRKFKKRNFGRSSLDWLNKAINLLDISIDGEPFDKETGYTVYEKPTYTVIIYRVENISEFEKFVRSFLSVTDEAKRVNKILKINVWSEKWYSDIYKSMVSTVKFSRYELDLLYKTEIMKYLYTDEEIDEFYSRWLTDEEENIEEEIAEEEEKKDDVNESVNDDDEVELL